MRANKTTPLFRTPVAVGRPRRLIGLGDRNVFLGSCFTEHVGQRFVDARLHALVNPLGVMYNPMSIARLLETEVSDPDRDYVLYKGMWHTWLGDTTLSNAEADTCRRATDQALSTLHAALAEADNLFLTLGTSRYYIYRETYEVVANCHRLPAVDFEESELSVEEIVDCLATALEGWHRRNARLRVVLTVSPHRYAKYGMHESQLSKARLLLAVETLQQRYPEWVDYFPAYEIVLDELRDYRFYAEDMLHPSDQAVDYIWQRLQDEWADDELLRYLERWEPIGRALAHRPLHPESAEYEAFRQRTQEQLRQLEQGPSPRSPRREESR